MRRHQPQAGVTAEVIKFARCGTSRVRLKDNSMYMFMDLTDRFPMQIDVQRMVDELKTLAAKI